MIASLLMLTVPSPTVSKIKIEQIAREMGMIYKDEVKAIFESK